VIWQGTHSAIAEHRTAIAVRLAAIAEKGIFMNNFDLFEEEFTAIAEQQTAIAEQQTAIAVAEIASTEPEIAIAKRGKNEEEKFSESFFVRCTKAEKLAVEEEAASFDLSQSRFFIAKALNAKHVLTREELQLFGNILQQLSGIGRNVNQIAVGLNTARLQNQPLEIERAELKRLTQEIQNLVAELKTESQKLWRS
jgi:hypothetical protein